MNELTYHAMSADIQLRKKLNELLDMRKILEENLKKASNPIAEERLKDNIIAVDELIGKIRYISLDKLNMLSNKENNEGNE